MKRHNPNELFVVTTVSRSTIAEMLNSEIGEECFASNDHRLTKEFCQEFADKLHLCIAENDEQTDCLTTLMVEEFLTRFDAADLDDEQAKRADRKGVR